MANSTADGSVVIDVNMDVSQAEKRLGKLRSDIKKTEKESADMTKARDEAKQKSVFQAAQLDAEKAKLQEIKDRLEEIRNLSKDKSVSVDKREAYAAQISSVKQEYDEQKTRVRALESEWNKTENAVDSYNKKIDASNQKLDDLKTEAGILTQEIDEAVKATGGMIGVLERAEKKLSSVLEKLQQQQAVAIEVNKALGDVVDTQTKLIGLSEEFALGAKIGLVELAKSSISVASKALSSAANFVSKIPEVLKSIPSILKSVFSKGAKFVASFGKNIIGVVKNMNVFSKLSRSLGNSFKWLGNTIKQALVFSVIYQGLALVREQMGAYLMANTQFSTALRQLQGVLLTAFQPIYDTVVPALTTLINALSRGIATVAQFTAALFGTTAKQAQKNADALYSEANALKETGSAAEEAAGSLAGFDEINSIQTEKQGGGGGSIQEIGPSFDYEYAETAFDSWGEAFNVFLDNLLTNGIPRLESAFLSFADWLNDFSKKLYDMFTFPGVLEKVRKLGDDLASALNGLVNRINWYQLGQALGAGMNLAMQFLVNLIYGFDWINLGMSLAELVNGAVAEIDWYAVGMLLWAGFKIAIESLAGFLLGLDMVQLAEAASNLVIGFFDSITETLASIDWMQIGIQVATFLANIDWAGVAESCFTAIGAAFGAAAAFLWGLIKDAWKKVVDWWHEVAYEDGEFTITGLLDGIWEVIKNIGSWVVEHIVDPFFDGIDKIFPGISDWWDDVKNWWKTNVSKFFTLEYWKGLGEDIIDGFLSGLKNAWDGLASWFSGVWDNLFGNRKVSVDVDAKSSAGNYNSSTRVSSRSIPEIAAYNIPALAKGAVIPPNREFLAVLGDQRSGTNIEAPLSTIEQAVENVLIRMGAGTDQPIQVNVLLDGKVVARNTVHHINDMTRQAGKPVLLL